MGYVEQEIACFYQETATPDWKWTRNYTFQTSYYFEQQDIKLSYWKRSDTPNCSPPAIKANMASKPGHPLAEIPLHEGLRMVYVGRCPKAVSRC